MPPKRQYQLSTSAPKIPEDDVSVQRSAIHLGSSGAAQIAQCLQTGTREVKNMLNYECEVILECKVCRSLFRGLANFLAHKRVYCTEMHHEYTLEVPIDGRKEEETVIVQPESPDAPGDTFVYNDEDECSLASEEPDSKDNDKNDSMRSNGSEEEMQDGEGDPENMLIGNKPCKIIPESIHPKSRDEKAICIGQPIEGKSEEYEFYTKIAEINAKNMALKQKATIVLERIKGVSNAMHQKKYNTDLTAGLASFEGKRARGRNLESVCAKLRSQSCADSDGDEESQEWKNRGRPKKNDDQKLNEADSNINFGERSKCSSIKDESHSKGSDDLESVQIEGIGYHGNEKVVVVEPQEAFGGSSHMTLRLKPRNRGSVVEAAYARYQQDYIAKEKLHKPGGRRELKGERKVYYCLFCTTYYCYPWNLKSHMERVHKKTKREILAMWDKVKSKVEMFDGKSGKIEVANVVDIKTKAKQETEGKHKDVGIDTKPISDLVLYICDACNKAFTTQQSLMCHRWQCVAATAQGRDKKTPKTQKESLEKLEENNTSASSGESSADEAEMKEEAKMMPPLGDESPPLLERAPPPSSEQRSSPPPLSKEGSPSSDPSEPGSPASVAESGDKTSPPKDKGLSTSPEIPLGFEAEDWKHVQSTIDITQLMCLKCGHKYNSTSSLHRHAVRHLGWCRYKCHLCRFTAYDKSECRAHLRRVHIAKISGCSTNEMSKFIVDLEPDMMISAKTRTPRVEMRKGERRSRRRQERIIDNIERECSKSPGGSSCEYNISTRKTPRHFDTRPYKTNKQESLQTLSTRSNTYKKSCWVEIAPRNKRKDQDEESCTSATTDTDEDQGDESDEDGCQASKRIKTASSDAETKEDEEAISEDSSKEKDDDTRSVAGATEAAAHPSNEAGEGQGNSGDAETPDADPEEMSASGPAVDMVEGTAKNAAPELDLVCDEQKDATLVDSHADVPELELGPSSKPRTETSPAPQHGSLRTKAKSSSHSKCHSRRKHPSEPRSQSVESKEERKPSTISRRSLGTRAKYGSSPAKMPISSKGSGSPSKTGGLNFAGSSRYRFMHSKFNKTSPPSVTSTDNRSVPIRPRILMHSRTRDSSTARLAQKGISAVSQGSPSSSAASPKSVSAALSAVLQGKRAKLQTGDGCVPLVVHGAFPVGSSSQASAGMSSSLSNVLSRAGLRSISELGASPNLVPAKMDVTSQSSEVTFSLGGSTNTVQVFNSTTAKMVADQGANSSVYLYVLPVSGSGPAATPSPNLDSLLSSISEPPEGSNKATIVANSNPDDLHGSKQAEPDADMVQSLNPTESDAEDTLKSDT